MCVWTLLCVGVTFFVWRMWPSLCGGGGPPCVESVALLVWRVWPSLCGGCGSLVMDV